MQEMKHERKFIDPLLYQYAANLDFEVQKNNKMNEFKERIEPFLSVKTLSEAKELAKKILPTANEINRFYIGDAKCTVVNKDNLLRIIIDSSTEYTCYNFQ